MKVDQGQIQEFEIGDMYGNEMFITALFRLMRSFCVWLIDAVGVSNFPGWFSVTLLTLQCLESGRIQARPTSGGLALTYSVLLDDSPP